VYKHDPPKRHRRVALVALACLSTKYCHRAVTCARASMTPADSIFRNSRRNFHVGAPATSRRMSARVAVYPAGKIPRAPNLPRSAYEIFRFLSLSLSLSLPLSIVVMPARYQMHCRRIVIHTIEKTVTQRVSLQYTSVSAPGDPGFVCCRARSSPPPNRGCTLCTPR